MLRPVRKVSRIKGGNVFEQLRKQRRLLSLAPAKLSEDSLDELTADFTKSQIHNHHSRHENSLPPLISRSDLNARFGPGYYHNARLETLKYLFLKKFIITLVGESKLVGVAKGSSDTLESVDIVLLLFKALGSTILEMQPSLDSLIQELIQITNPNGMGWKVKKGTITNEDRKKIKKKLSTILESLEPQVYGKLFSKIDRNFMSRNSFRFPSLDMIEGEKFFITSYSSPESTTQALKKPFKKFQLERDIIRKEVLKQKEVDNVEETVEYQFAMLGAKKRLAQNIIKVLIHPAYHFSEIHLLFLLSHFNALGLHQYGECIFEVCTSKHHVQVSDSLFKELLIHTRKSGNSSWFLKLVKSIICPLHDRDAHSFRRLVENNNLYINYVHTYEVDSKNANGNSSFKTQFKSQELLPPIKDIRAIISRWKGLWGQEVNNRPRFFSDRFKPQYFRILTEDGDTSEVMVQKVPEYGYATTISADTILAAIQGCEFFRHHDLVDVLTYKLMLDSALLAYVPGGDSTLRINVSPQRFPKKYLAGNNLSMQDHDLQSIFPISLIHSHLRKVETTQDRRQLKWLLNLVEVMHLSPLAMKVSNKISKLMYNDRKRFDKIYDKFFDIDEIIKFEMSKQLKINGKFNDELESRKLKVINSLEQPQDSEDPDYLQIDDSTGKLPKLDDKALRFLYQVCFKLKHYKGIEKLESKYKVDFDRLFSDDEYRASTKAIIDKELRESNFREANDQWKHSRGKLSIRALFMD
ncbi:hypothetical protein DASC09_016620 [Saccharomycopsis crataegensis]|uniref:Uncharacterized protein n=1 Tax=Saccharomycopsis crataegensis TaxID=43959 RepID=A0AAV5QIC2_9ASCO|nr:hypothetical protein DASC09_016620 [Saccharomycopsis crataegensis]